MSSRYASAAGIPLQIWFVTLDKVDGLEWSPMGSRVNWNVPLFGTVNAVYFRDDFSSDI